ncbi:MAG: cation:proton antiporter [Roseiarcus sp.]|jgi:CPA1 family monovalent cation:H+ antiporter
MDLVLGRTIELLGVAMVVAILARRLRLPYTVGLVLTGLALALTHADAGVTLTHDVIFDEILPPLLFEAAIAIPWSELKRELPPVLALATFGVVLCAAVVAAGLTTLLGWPAGPALAFGALIAATDPIAVIALLRETGVKGRLRLITESESLINDGVAALLFTLVVASLGGTASAPTPLGVLGQALLIGGGGVAVGLAVAGVAILLAGRTNDHLVETALTAVAAYGSFLMAERIGASGVLATVSAGLLMGNLGVLADESDRFALSSQGRAFVVAFWEFAAFVANSLVFLLIGLALGATPTRSFGALAVVVALALAGRAAAVYPVSFLFARSRWALSWPEQHFLWWGGLRGALALALALSLPPAAPYRDEILVAAFGVVAFSVLVQGLTAKPALRLLRLGAARK